MATLDLSIAWPDVSMRRTSTDIYFYSILGTVHVGVAMLLSYLPDVLCIVLIYGLEVDMLDRTRDCADTLPTLILISRDRLEQADSRIYTASPSHRFHHNEHRLHHIL